MTDDNLFAELISPDALISMSEDSALNVNNVTFVERRHLKRADDRGGLRDAEQVLVHFVGGERYTCYDKTYEQVLALLKGEK